MQVSIFYSSVLYLFFGAFKGYYFKGNDAYMDMDMPSYYGNRYISLVFEKLEVRFPPYGI